MITRTRTHTAATLAITGLIALTAACSGQTVADEPAPPTLDPDAGIGQVLLLGDSVAAGEALPLREAFAAAGVPFESRAATGGGNVVGPGSEERWGELPGEIAAADPEIVIYQLTSYDWGTRAEQQAGYERLVATVAEVGADLLFVTMPPIEPDDFYAPHMDELERADDVAAEVAEASGGDAVLLDAQAVWSPTYQREREGTLDRSSDGIHTCPQGAARFTAWLLDELAAAYPGFTPPDPAQWANTGWASAEDFPGC
ncbi:SGNH/GDSL hydrolase family protein [Ruania zhangjianzhongii]|uniref:SGNH/GDSL hydrolase family protein n=1 Tax=Ruania zhangjianzhongii TaxID=2603206 RepID=UPI0011D227CF|nr:SGNH/GDSL hydrolase family protein [Ruania zhangjianzhongii]